MSDTTFYGIGITFVIILLSVGCLLLAEIRDELKKLVGRGQSGD